MVIGFRFGISTHLFHEQPLERAHLADIAAAGFDLIELFATRSHIDYRDAARTAEIRGWLDELGLTAWSMHAPITDSFGGSAPGRSFSIGARDPAARDEALAETTAAIEAAVTLGVSVLVLHPGAPGTGGSSGENDPTAVRRGLTAVSRACRDAGLQLALENIPNDLATAAALVDWLEADLDPPPAGVCFDTGHAHLVDGVDRAIDLLAGTIVTTHVHDNRGQADDHLVPFGGTVDWRSALFALVKTGYAGPLVFELPSHGDAARTLAAAVSARGRFQAILDELAAPFPFEEA